MKVEDLIKELKSMPPKSEVRIVALGPVTQVGLVRAIGGPLDGARVVHLK